MGGGGETEEVGTGYRVWYRDLLNGLNKSFIYQLLTCFSSHLILVHESLTTILHNIYRRCCKTYFTGSNMMF